MTPVGTAAGVVLVFVSGSWLFGTLPATAHGPIHEQVAALTTQIQQDSQNAVLYLKRGELRSYDGDWDAALADYEHAAQLDPALAAVDLARGKTFLQAGRYSQAKIALDGFLTNYPDHAEALATRARVLVKLGQGSAAAKDYSRAIMVAEKLGRPNPEYYLERARALAGEEGVHVDEALRGLDEGVGKLGPIVTLQLDAINLELMRKQYDAALVRLETITAQSPRKEAWLARRGEILAQAGRAAEARLAYEQALAAMESFPPRHRKTRATTKLEAQVRSALARLAASENKKADP